MREFLSVQFTEKKWATWMLLAIFLSSKKRSFEDILTTQKSKIHWGLIRFNKSLLKNAGVNNATHLIKRRFHFENRLYNILVESCFDKCVAVGYGGVSRSLHDSVGENSLKSINARQNAILCLSVFVSTSYRKRPTSSLSWETMSSQFTQIILNLH